MTARQPAKAPAQLPDDWNVLAEFRIHGRVLRPGTEFSVAGERGRFRFVKAVVRPDGTCWIDGVGGPEGHPLTRSFRPTRIKTVHAKERLR